MSRLVFLIGAFLLVVTTVQAQTVTTKITGAKLRNVVIAEDGVDPCAGVAVGDPCPNGVLYAGTGFAGLGTYRYMTTPGNCTDSVTPTCNGATDSLMKTWGTFGIDTGAISETDGANNTTTLAVNYACAAADYCQDMTYPAGGYTDWYLPAKDELNLVLYAMHMAGKGNFVSADYHSSMEYNLYNFWYQNFSTGDQLFLPDHKGDSLNYVRCVRRY
jgi:hypothetical protein